MAGVIKKLFVVFVVAGIVIFFGCGKNLPDTSPCNNLSPDADSAQLLTFAHDSSFQVIRDSSGLYYQILDPGNNTKPVSTSNVSVTYVARLMTGAIFDSATNSNLNGYTIGKLIPGWQYGIPKIGVGGHIRLLVPSDYGYGCAGYPPYVPSNAPLYFDVKLLQVN
jgi:FKBP-type peptidyl-prolyl cis-trans isomerase FkpA